LDELNKKRKGYTAEKTRLALYEIALLCAIVMLLMYKLSLYKGVPYILLAHRIVAVYTYITAKTTFGRHFYALGGNEKATKLSVSTRTASISRPTSTFPSSALWLPSSSPRASPPPTPPRAPTMSWTPSAPASSAAHPLTAASARSAACRRRGTHGVLNLGMNIIGVDSNFQKVVRASSCWQPLSSTS
jgi:putative multiple sugar transport system permease protein